MAIEHKAFVFDYNLFEQELASILDDALSSNDSKNLINFIENNLLYLKDPYEGEPLDSSWKDMIETDEVSQYGDFAITKYYEPQFNIGIGYDWEQINDSLLSELHVKISPLLGLLFGSEKNYFDPGKLGSYFQSPEKVQENFNLLKLLHTEKPEYLPKFALVETMLSEGLKKGLYITF